MKNIILEVKHVSNYGKSFFYPVNNTGKQFCELLGAKTLTKDQLTLIKTMGIEIKVITENVTI